MNSDALSDAGREFCDLRNILIEVVKSVAYLYTLVIPHKSAHIFSVRSFGVCSLKEARVPSQGFASEIEGMSFRHVRWSNRHIL
jgi:hypothetical protein